MIESHDERACQYMRNKPIHPRYFLLLRSAICILVLFQTLLFAAAKEVIDIPSPSMKKNFKAMVIVPDSYQSTPNRYSIIYCLHGYSGNYQTWPEQVPLMQYADRYQVILICPDGNFASWYLDSPVKANSKFETFIITEAIPFIDKKYRSFSNDKGRAIIGSSMGGHGALTLIAKHPDMFIGAGSISGIMDLTEFPTQWDLPMVLGVIDKSRQQWIDHSFIGLIPKLAGKNRGLVLDCGISDFALPGNRRAHEQLMLLSIPHDYYERPGEHSPAYIRQNAEFHILYLMRLLKAPALE
jgi:putative tributyrin esterase